MALALREAQKILDERADLLRSTELALHEMTERADRDVERLRLLESDKEALGREKEAQYSRVVAHEAKIGALHDENTRLQRALEETASALAEAAGEAARVPGLVAASDEAATRLDRAREDVSRLEKERDAARADYAAEQNRRRGEVEHLENALRIARGEARDAADRLEVARADNAMLQGAVEALRAERAQQRRLGAASPAVSEAEDIAALRAAIVDFGEEVARLADKAQASTG
jgi:chromosome segregation ATPase